MNCSCLQNIKVKPNEFCIFCVHKHLTTALSLSEFVTNEKRVVDYRIAAQVNLAILHLIDKAKDYENEIVICRNIIFNVINKKEYFSDLNKIVDYFWKESNSIEPIRLKYEEKKEIDNNSIEFALLKMSIAIELMKYEISYENVNYSTAIGQLVNAGWVLNNIDKQLSEQCRNIYHDIENRQADISKIESFRFHLLNKYI